MNTNTSKLNDAFKALRKAGFIARQNFMCCGNCASHALAAHIKGMTPLKRERVKGAVFYTRQNTAAFRRRDSQIYLAYGPVGVQGLGTFGRDASEVGTAVVEALKAAGLEVEWDGNPGNKIVVGR